MCRSRFSLSVPFAFFAGDQDLVCPARASDRRQSPLSLSLTCRKSLEGPFAAAWTAAKLYRNRRGSSARASRDGSDVTVRRQLKRIPPGDGRLVNGARMRDAGWELELVH